MDLLRLGLERGRTADDAKRAITDLLERHGQGGSAQYGGRRFYHNSFIIADPGTAWVLETSGRHWVARRVRGRAAVSNLATIGDDWDGAVPALPLADTVKLAEGEAVAETVDRAGLFAVQTPQAFLAGPLRRALAGVDDATDCAGLVEAAGGRVRLVEGDRRLVKVTTPADLDFVETLLGAER